MRVAVPVERQLAGPVRQYCRQPQQVAVELGIVGAVELVRHRELEARRDRDQAEVEQRVDVGAQRRQWLLDQGLAKVQAGDVRFSGDLIATLQRRELQRLVDQLSEELGLTFAEARTGDRVEGVLHRRVDLASGRYALIAKSQEFTLVPWRPLLSRRVGQSVTGIARASEVN